MAKIKEILTAKGEERFRVFINKDGKRLNRTFKTFREADDFLQSATRSAEINGTLDSVDTPTLSQLYPVFLGEYFAKDSSMTHRLGFWVEHLGHYPINQITAQRVKLARVKLKHIGGNKHGLALSGSTQNRYLSALGTFYKWAANHPDYETMDFTNPTRDVTRRKEGKPIVNWLNAEERISLLEASKKCEWAGMYPAIQLSLVTGARKASVLGLKWQDIEFDTGIVTFLETKNGEDLVLELDPETLTILKQWRLQCGSTKYLFPHPKNKNSSIYNIVSHYKNTLRHAGINRHFRWHDLRHDTATRLWAGGMSKSKIQDVLGHKTSAMTERYTHLTEAVKLVAI